MVLTGCLNMTSHAVLGLFEQAVLLSVKRLSGLAYGSPIADELSCRLGRKVSTGAVYSTLERLVEKELLITQALPPRPMRGGRFRVMHSVTTKGEVALIKARTVTERVWREDA